MKDGLASQLPLLSASPPSRPGTGCLGHDGKPGSPSNPMGKRMRPPALFEVVLRYQAIGQSGLTASSPSLVAAAAFAKPTLSPGSSASTKGHGLSWTRSPSCSTVDSPTRGSPTSTTGAWSHSSPAPLGGFTSGSSSSSSGSLHWQRSSVFFVFPGKPPRTPEVGTRAQSSIKLKKRTGRQRNCLSPQAEVRRNSGKQFANPTRSLRRHNSNVEPAMSKVRAASPPPAGRASTPLKPVAKPALAAALPQAVVPEPPKEFVPLSLADLEQSRRAHQIWAAEAFATIFASAVIDGTHTSDLKGLNTGALQGSICRMKLGECLVGTVHDASQMEAVVNAMVVFICKKTMDVGGQLLYRDFEDFTWNLKHMEHQLLVEGEPEFVFKMFGGNKIGNLSKKEFMQLFREAEDSMDFQVSEKPSQHGRRARVASITIQTELGEETLGAGATKLDHALGIAPELAEAHERIPATPVAWGHWAVPSEASASPRSDGSAGGSRESSPAMVMRRSSRNASKTVQPPPVSLAHLGSLSEVPTAWRDLVRKKGLMHRDWAASRFASLDEDNDGYLEHGQLIGENFARIMLECLGDRLSDRADIEILVDAATRGADAEGDHVDGDGRLGEEDFEAFTWRLKRMIADTDFEVGQALGFAAGSAWRDLVARVRKSHHDWALFAFSALDAEGSGHLAREDLRRPGFEHLLGQCPGGRLADAARVRLCFGLAFRRADMRGMGRLNRHEFEDFTWQLSRMGLDVEQEAYRFAELVKAEMEGQEAT